MATEIINDIYDITCETSNNGSRYRVFFDVKDTPTLFDTGFERTTETVIREIDEIGITPERLIITHGDPDHIGGYDSLVEYYSLETWVPKQMTTVVENEPTYEYDHETSIGRFSALHLPGHKADSYVHIDEEDSVAIIGDALFGSDRRGLPPGYFILPPATYSENLIQAENSLERLLEYSFETGLVFHGTSVVESASSKLDRFVDI